MGLQGFTYDIYFSYHVCSINVKVDTRPTLYGCRDVGWVWWDGYVGWHMVGDVGWGCGLGCGLGMWFGCSLLSLLWKASTFQTATYYNCNPSR